MTRPIRSSRMLGAALFMCGSLAARAADPSLVARGAYLAKAGDCDRQIVRQCLQPSRARRPLELFKLIVIADIFLVPKNVRSRVAIRMLHQVEVSAF